MGKKNIPTTTSIFLTEPQVKVLRFMVDGYQSGATPSVREVCDHFGWSSPNAAHKHIKELAKRKLVEQRGNVTARILPLALKLYGRQ